MTVQRHPFSLPIHWRSSFGPSCWSDGFGYEPVMHSSFFFFFSFGTWNIRRTVAFCHADCYCCWYIVNCCKFQRLLLHAPHLAKDVLAEWVQVCVTSAFLFPTLATTGRHFYHSAIQHSFMSGFVNLTIIWANDNNMSNDVLLSSHLSANARQYNGMIEVTAKREELLQAGELAVVSWGDRKAICVLDYVRQRRGMWEKLFAHPFLSLCRCQW